jgi:serine protease Do
LRVKYGNGVCLIVGVYDLVSRQNGKQLRYPDPTLYQPDPYEPMEGEDPAKSPPVQMGLTTEGNGAPVEYDFIGTGFHVGSGYIVTNRHVVQPWEEDDLVKQMMRQANGKPRIKRLVVYFPDLPNPISFRLQQLDTREDLAVGSIDPNAVSPDIPVLPIDTASEAVRIGKTVVTMGYPNGPERLLAMLPDDEARSIQGRFGNSRQALLNYLAQSRKIQPLTTPGAITDLDKRRIVHDAKTAEGGSGAPLFGQSGKVIGVNFGVFTENTASNMAVPVSFAVELLRRAGWKSPEEIQAAQNQPTQTASNETNPPAQPKPQ